MVTPAVLVGVATTIKVDAGPVDGGGRAQRWTSTVARTVIVRRRWTFCAGAGAGARGRNGGHEKQTHCQTHAHHTGGHGGASPARHVPFDTAQRSRPASPCRPAWMREETQTVRTGGRGTAGVALRGGRGWTRANARASSCSTFGTGTTDACAGETGWGTCGPPGGSGCRAAALQGHERSDRGQSAGAGRWAITAPAAWSGLRVLASAWPPCFDRLDDVEIDVRLADQLEAGARDVAHGVAVHDRADAP